MASTIKKHEMMAYVRDAIYPLFNKEWVCLGPDTLARRSNYLVQGVTFFRLSTGMEFKVNYFMQLLAIPSDVINLSLGGALKEPAKKRLMPMFQSEPRELRVGWDQRFDQASRIVRLIRTQLHPAVDEQLSLESAYTWLSEKNTAQTDPVINWTAGILMGLLGNSTGAKAILSSLAEFFERSSEAFRQAAIDKKSSEMDKRAGIEMVRRNQVMEAIASLDSRDSFISYCDLVANNTSNALKLPS